MGFVNAKLIKISNILIFFFCQFNSRQDLLFALFVFI